MSFISPAFAQGADAGGGSGIEAMLPLVLIFVVFYFLLIRPQQKKVKQHKEMLNAVRRGDRVVTGGGIIGTITKVIDDNEVNVEIADGIKVRVQRGLIASVLSKTEPVKDDAGKGGKGGKGGKAANDAKGDDAAPATGAAKLKNLFGGKSK